MISSVHASCVCIGYACFENRACSTSTTPSIGGRHARICALSGCRPMSGTYKTAQRRSARIDGMSDDREPIRFETKIAVLLREDLAGWQLLNVTAFLSSAIAGAVDGVLGEPYVDASDV